MKLNLRGLCLLVLALPLAAPAQEADQAEVRAAEIEALEPGMSSDALDAMDDRSSAAADPAAILAADVRRTSVTSGVMDELDLGRTEITGNQELPKVLYIVPWQKSDPGDLLGKPVNSLLDEVLAPVDRSEFMRQVDYYGDLQGKDEE